MIWILLVTAIFLLATQVAKLQYFSPSSIFWAPTISAFLLSYFYDNIELDTTGKFFQSLIFCLAGLLISILLAGIVFISFRPWGRFSPMKIVSERKAWVAIFFSLLIAGGATLNLSAGEVVCSDSKCRSWLGLFGGDPAYANIFVSLLLFNISTFGPLCSAVTMINRVRRGID